MPGLSRAVRRIQVSLAPRFHPLRVADVRAETADAVSITFDVPAALAPAFRFDAGQYLTLRTTLDGAEVRRSYSICSGPDDGELRIAIKRVPGGQFSGWATRDVTPGAMLDVMSPTGRFGVVHVPDAARNHVGFAAGSGITPILSIARGVLSREPHSRFFLFYGARTAADLLFREALEELKDRYLGRLSVFPVLSQEQQDVPVLNGRLDADKARLLLRHVVPAAMVDHAFLCGPAGMIEDLEAALLGVGLTPAQIHIERFVSAHAGKPRPAPVATPDAPPFAIAALIVDGRRTEVPVAEHETVLDAALRAGLDLPYACKGGMCSTCRAHITEGAVTMALNFSLEPWETEAGYVLTCQAHPTTARVVVDFDQV